MVRQSDFAIMRRVLDQARPFWLQIAGLALFDLLATPLVLLLPLPLKIAVDNVLGSQPLPAVLSAFVPDWAASTNVKLLALAAALQVLVVLLIHLQALSSYFLSSQIGEALTLAFRARLFGHVQRLSLLYHDSKGTADSIYRIQYDAASIQWITLGAIPLVTASVKLLSMIYVIARIDWQLAVVALAVAPMLLVVTHTYKQRMRPYYRGAKELESHALGVVQEVLTAVRVVKAFGREDNEQERFVLQSRKGMQARVRLSFAEGLFGLIVNVTTAVGTAAVLFIGIRTVQRGIITLGELLMISSYLAQLYEPLKTFSRTIANMQSSLTSAHRAFELLAEAPEVVERPNARPLKRAMAAIEFRNVSFAYDTKNPVLRGVSFCVEAGSWVGIAGKTGAGKTSLVSLLTRFYDPNSGQILLDGEDLREYRLADLRDQFAIVLQEPVLFSTSIAENIAYARPGVHEEDIRRAAVSANAHDFIMNLPDGYDTLVGERGMRLSGGERQRIALARAFLKDAPILILDEPTASVDLETERVILEAMERLMHGRTAFMIAHRLSTLENCDVLLTIEDGRCVVVSTGASTTSAAARVAFAPSERRASVQVD
jgi:ATP-binding cassette subfamily B protein